MFIKFINRLLMKIALTLITFIFVCAALDIEPGQMIGQVKQGIDTFQELKGMANNIQNNQGDLQGLLDQFGALGR